MQQLVGQMRRASTPTTLMPALRLFRDCLLGLPDDQNIEAVKDSVWEEFLSPNSTKLLFGDLSIAPGSLGPLDLGVYFYGLDALLTGISLYSEQIFKDDKDRSTKAHFLSQLHGIVLQNMKLLVDRPALALLKVGNRSVGRTVLLLLCGASNELDSGIPPTSIIGDPATTTFFLSRVYERPDGLDMIEAELGILGQCVECEPAQVQVPKMDPAKLSKRCIELFESDLGYTKMSISLFRGACVFTQHALTTPGALPVLVNNARIHILVVKWCWGYLRGQQSLSGNSNIAVAISGDIMRFLLSILQPLGKIHGPAVVHDLLQEQNLILLIGRPQVLRPDAVED
ncbi:hypothetical protein FRB99_002553, partial [Tulasnella sp. 403]